MGDPRGPSEHSEPQQCSCSPRSGVDSGVDSRHPVPSSETPSAPMGSQRAAPTRASLLQTALCPAYQVRGRGKVEGCNACLRPPPPIPCTRTPTHVLHGHVAHAPHRRQAEVQGEEEAPIGARLGGEGLRRSDLVGRGVAGCGGGDRGGGCAGGRGGGERPKGWGEGGEKGNI